MRHISLRALAVIILLLSDAALAATPNRVTILYDSFGKNPALTMDWGFAALVEYGGKRILFDTGNNAQILEHNVKTAGVDLQKLDFVVMSHRHGDHMGGLAYLLKVNPTVKIYAPKERSGVYGDDQPSKFGSDGWNPADAVFLLHLSSVFRGLREIQAIVSFPGIAVGLTGNEPRISCALFHAFPNPSSCGTSGYHFGGGVARIAVAASPSPRYVTAKLSADQHTGR